MFSSKKKPAPSTSLILVIFFTVETVLCAPITNNNDDLEFIILHNNDMHARFEQTSALSNQCTPEDAAANRCYGGFARTAHEIRKFRAEANKTGVLYLNAGDTYTGTPWFTVFKDNITAAFLNILAPDAISLGNHEFDEGVAGLVPFLDKVNFPVLAANLDLSNTPELANKASLVPSKVFIINGVKIGVIGYLTPDTKELTTPTTVEFYPEVEAINIEAKVLKNEGVNIIIALGHSGYDTDQKIGRECPEVDVVVGGHSNTFLYTGQPPDIEIPFGPYPQVVKQKSGKQVPVVQAYAFTKYLGYLKLKFNAKGDLIKWDGSPILLNGTVPEDSDVLQLLEFYRPNITRLQNELVGTTRVLLDGSKQSCRKEECNLGDLITDAMVRARVLEYADDSSSYWTDAPIALLNGGGIRGSIEKNTDGTITFTDVLSVLPFRNALYVINVTGHTLLAALEHSAFKRSQVDSNGGFLQMSGIHVVYNISKPFGQQVQKVEVRCSRCSVPQYEKLDLDKTYKIVLNEFLLVGGDGHRFTNATNPLDTEQKLKRLDNQALAEYLKERSPVYQGIDWRIIVTGEYPKESSSANRLNYNITFVTLIVMFTWTVKFIC